MRISRRMGIHTRLGMNPDSVTTTGGKMQYWSNYGTDTDKWHNTIDEKTGGVRRHKPYDNYPTYIGINGNRAYHNAAIAFKTGSFTGKGKRVSLTISSQAYNITGGFSYAAQLSKHNWDTEKEWLAGSKVYYSEILTSLPNDPNAIASTTGTFPQSSKRYNVTLSIDADILPNTEYVIYIIGTSAVVGHLFTMDKTEDYPMTITVTE